MKKQRQIKETFAESRLLRFLETVEALADEQM